MNHDTINNTINGTITDNINDTISGIINDTIITKRLKGSSSSMPQKLVYDRDKIVMFKVHKWC